jgi:hypothetical protein
MSFGLLSSFSINKYLGHFFFTPSTVEGMKKQMKFNEGHSLIDRELTSTKDLPGIKEKKNKIKICRNYLNVKNQKKNSTNFLR